MEIMFVLIPEEIIYVCVYLVINKLQIKLVKVDINSGLLLLLSLCV